MTVGNEVDGGGLDLEVNPGSVLLVAEDIEKVGSMALSEIEAVSDVVQTYSVEVQSAGCE